MATQRPRISKTTDERRAEIVECARRLFAERGFTATKISAIVRELGVSQGVFYYYFESKESVVEAIIEAHIGALISKGREIIARPKLSAIEKLEALADLQWRQNQAEAAGIHAIKGVDIHERLLSAMITRFVPLMQEAWGGKTSDGYNFEIFLTAGMMLFDPGIFAWSDEMRNARIEHLITTMETAMGQSAGTFAFYRRVMGHGG